MASWFRSVGEMFAGGAREGSGVAKEPTSSTARRSSAATEITSYDADHDGVLDPVEQLLKEYDLNGDHRYSTVEVKHMVEAMLTHHDSGRKYKRAAGALATTLVALIACVFGTAYLADDVTKEMVLGATTNIMTGTDGRALLFGANFVRASEHDDTRRRLHTLGGRQLVEVGEIDPSQVKQVTDAIKNNVTSGTIQITTSSSRRRRLVDLSTAMSTIIASGYVIGAQVIGDTLYYVVTGSSGGPMYWLTLDGTVLSQSPSRRLRQLHATESHEREHQRRLAEATNSTARPPPKCWVYHCFEGDERCPEPSPRHLCARWAADGTSCLEPTCAYMDFADAALYDNRRRMAVTSCSTDADCEANCFVDYTTIAKRVCSTSTSTCVECNEDSDCLDRPSYSFDLNDDFLRGCASHECVQCTKDDQCDRGNCRTPGESGTLYTCETCFPAHATVTTPTGPKRMDELEVGDRVLVDGGAAYSTVYLHAHEDRRADVRHDFVRVELSTGHELELSPDHLARLADGTYVVAADVRVGMKMHVATAEPKSVDESAAAAVVTATSLVRRTGLFAPITLHGDIVVDGVVASSYASIMSRALPPPLRRSGTLLNALAHALAAPMRALHAVDPALLEHIMQTVPRTESGGFSLFSFRGAGGLLAIKEAINSGLAVVPPPSLARRALAATAAYGWLATASTIAAASSMLSSAATATSAVAAALLGVAAAATKGGGGPE